MIFTTVVVSCLFALLGVFQSTAVDTLLSTLARLHTPALPSLAALLQIAGSITRLAAPLPYRHSSLLQLPYPHSSLLQLPTPTIHTTFTNPTASASASLLPPSLQKICINSLNPFDRRADAFGEAEVSAQNTMIDIDPGLRLLLLFLVFSICSHIVNSIRGMPTAKRRDGSSLGNTEASRPRTPVPPNEHISTSDSPSNGHAPFFLEDAELPGGLGQGGGSGPREVPYDPLAFIRCPTSTRPLDLLSSLPPAACISPALSTTSNLSDISDWDDHLIFGVPRRTVRSALAFGPPSAGAVNQEEEEELDEYLRFALDIRPDGSPPLEGWVWPEGPPVPRLHAEELRGWTFPSADPDTDDPFDPSYVLARERDGLRDDPWLAACMVGEG